MNETLIKSQTVIVADGNFPGHEIPLGYIRNAERIICCDGSAENVLKAGYIPEAIVGDMDSLTEDMASRFADRLFINKGQDTNDLTKAVEWCRSKYYIDLVIVGATGKREDHTIGNISLLADYASKVNVQMVTDTGIFRPFLESCTISSFPGQKISLFSIDPETDIKSTGLKYPLANVKISNWWIATLNEALEDSFSLEFSNGRVIVYLKFKE